MKEKTKQILRYIACGVGGLALGIGLLGGLAMCASSGKSAKAESVNTIYSDPKREQIDTGSTGGNYTGYRFEVSSLASSLSEYAPCYRARIFDVDTSSYTLTPWAIASDPVEIGMGWNAITNAISTTYNLATPAEANGMTFSIIEGYSDLWGNGSYGHWYYYTFKTRQAGAFQETFIETKNYAGYAIKTTANNYAWSGTPRHPTITTAQQTLYYVPTSASQGYVFQDVASYYKALGYGDGYEQGDTDGYNTGYWAGYNEGIGTASSFTDISANLNAVYDLTTMGVSTATWQNVHGLTDVKIYTLLQFFDNEQDTWNAYIVDGLATDQPSGTRTMYVDVAQLSSTSSQTIGRAIYNNASMISLQEVSTAHFEFAQIRNVSNRSLSLNLLLLYGWTNDNTAYQAGYQAGLKDGFENTNTNNVFSLFTSAFTAVGGFFNLKVFGFLPLYWFFLTPLFVALITLLLRMVKH